MDKSEPVLKGERLTRKETEVSMETQVIPEASPTLRRPILNTRCTHQRVIDDVLTRGGKRTGKVRCLECGTIFDDPYQGSK